MTTLWQVPVVVAALLTWLGTPPASIGEAAEREAFRRLLTPRATRAYTNVDLPAALPHEVGAVPAVPAMAGSSVLSSPPAVPAAAEPPAAPAGAARAAGAEARDESWWRGRVAAIRTDIERNEMVLEAMQTRINALTADVVRRDDPFQRAELRDQLQRALADFDRIQGLIIQGRQALEDLREGARRAGVPPGWLR